MSKNTKRYNKHLILIRLNKKINNTSSILLLLQKSKLFVLEIL
jgi:hypothetical protein